MKHGDQSEAVKVNRRLFDIEERLRQLECEHSDLVYVEGAWTNGKCGCYVKCKWCQKVMKEYASVKEWEIDKAHYEIEMGERTLKKYAEELEKLIGGIS